MYGTKDSGMKTPISLNSVFESIHCCRYNHLLYIDSEKKKTKKTSFPFCSLKILQMIKEKTYKMSGNQFFISIFSFMHFFILFGIFFIVNCICLCVLKFS